MRWVTLIFFCLLSIACQSTIRYSAVKENSGNSDGLEHFISGWLGTPYRYGGMNKDGVDCSGFVFRLMREVYGIRLPRSSRNQFRQGKKIPRSRLRKGDLIFFNLVSRRGVDHVGFYLGDNKFVHASTEAGVTISNLGESYYKKHYYGACRYLIE